jgi:predicted dehydrogenase
LEKTELSIGIIGAGGFARFAAQAFVKCPGVKLIALMDVNKGLARQMGEELNMKVYNEFEQILDDESIDLIYIATPPFLHYMQSKQALLAGKHVICEKPAALNTTEAEELSSIAESRHLLYVVNLMQRYNPLNQMVKIIIAENILGNFLHGYFENYASDQNLGPDHWFWDESKSGGIFIEHGVHFFDLFAGWLGEGKVLGAWHLLRPDLQTKIIDRVQATVLYPGGLVNFYHGFDQPEILDRQEMRLLFEHGEITLYGWIPVEMKLHGLLKTGQLKKLQDGIGPFSTFHHEKLHADQRIKGRFRERVYEDHVTIDYVNALGKQKLYQQMLVSMISDQWNWIKNHQHVRLIDHRNAVCSTRMAEQATRISQNFNHAHSN